MNSAQSGYETSEVIIDDHSVSISHCDPTSFVSTSGTSGVDGIDLG
jgi:hypothetical protein